MPTPETAEKFAEFVAARYAALLRTARMLVSNPADAEDLVQEALTRCVPKWATIADDPEGYVRTVLVRTNISRWRRQRIAEVAIEYQPDLGRWDPDVSEQQALLAALTRLSPRQRTAVVLRHVEDRSERETAELMGCAVGTVKSQTAAGLARLRILLREAEVTPAERVLRA